MEIVFPENTGEIITAIRNAIGRAVTFYVVASSTACTLCDLEPITNTSTDPFCLECNGTYWIPVMSGVTLSGHVAWGKSDQMRWESGGQWWEGSAGVQIAYTPTNLETVESAVYVVVDDQEMEVRKVMRRGVKSLNRILIDLIERTKVE
jgi:hypothetical protein